MRNMNPTSGTAPARRDWRKIAGFALSGIVILFLLMDAAMKLVPGEMVVSTTAQLGWPADPATLRTLAIVLLAATLLYAWPRSAVLGAILITGYLGGTVATHARIGSPVFSHLLFGVYLGVMTWGGLWLRDPRMRALLPFGS